MESKDHILFLTPGFPKNEKDTTCLPYFQNYLLHFIKYRPNTELTIISFQYPFLKKEYQWNGIRVIALGGSNKKYGYKILLWRRALKIIRHIHQKLAIRLIHSLWLKECALIGNYIAKQLKVGHICTAMGTEVIKSQNHFLKILNPNQMTIVAVSNFQKAHLQKSFPQIKIKCIPWGIARPPHLKLKPYNKRQIDILGVGSLIELKNYLNFIHIIQQLLEEKPNLVVRIIGDGVQRGLLEREIKRKKLEKTIKLIGQMDNSEVWKYMQNSKVFLHTSTFESQGYVFLEALLNGMKIVSRKVGIAEKSDYWGIGNDMVSLSSKVSQALAYFEPQIVLPYPIQKTIDDYCHLYEI